MHSFQFPVTNNLHPLFSVAPLFTFAFSIQSIGNHCEQSEQWEPRVCQSVVDAFLKVVKLVFNHRLKIVLVIRANAQIISVNFTASTACYLILILIVITPQRELN